MFGGNSSTGGMRTPKSTSGMSVNNGFKSPKRQERVERQNNNFQVVIRVRPPLPRELSGEIPFRNVIAVDDREQTITISENIEAVVDNSGQMLANPGPYTTYSFVFDYVYDQYSSQEKVYETTARTVVDSALQGYNATIFAYGQTGAGKTYTMEGFNRDGNLENRGIIPRAIEQIFGHIQTYASPRMRFLVRASYLQIYNEQISDLLKPDRNNLQIREDKRRGVYVDGLSEWVVRSPAEIYGLMDRGASVRTTGETKMNDSSSRSHAVFIVIAEQSETVYVDDQGREMTPEEFQRFMHARGVRSQQEMNRLEDHVKQTFKVGKLNLVDLAGSERVQRSGATGVRLEESKQINKSLSMLGYVIKALTEAKDRQHVPYRNSKLTRMLEDSLGGNCKTTMMAMISPAFEAMLETISTLKFANRAKNIKNEARVNEDLDQKSLLRKYERELKKLRAELEERSKNVVDKRRLLELDEQRRRAEADKMAAIRALEARSIEFMKEKEEKKRLEQRISMLMGQMIRGDKTGLLHPNDPNFPPQAFDPTTNENYDLNAENEIIMKEQQDKLRQEYEYKLTELEKERETIEEEKAQVDRYKQLLLKQRDIMIALTQRLVERDEQIMALQDELDAYDRHHKELEEKLDEKTAQLIKLQRISMEVNATSPYKNEELNKALERSFSQEERRRKMNGPQEIVQEAEDGDNEEIIHDDKSIPMSSPPSSSTNSPLVIKGGSTGPNPVSLKASVNGKQIATNTANSQQNEEKLKELNNIIESQKKQLISLETKIAESQLSTSRVERVFHSEIDSYLKDLPNEAARASVREAFKMIMSQASKKLKESNVVPANDLSQMELQRVKEENEKLKQQASRASMEAANQSQLTADNSTLKAKCDSLVKEREAVQTIMEEKIKVLVQSLAQSAGTVMNTSPVGNSPAGQALTKDLASLQRLVNASIAALRNAASNSTSGGSSSNGSNSVASLPSAVSRSNSLNAPPPPPPSSSASLGDRSMPPPAAFSQQRSFSNSGPPPPPSSSAAFPPQSSAPGGARTAADYSSTFASSNRSINSNASSEAFSYKNLLAAAGNNPAAAGSSNNNYLSNSQQQQRPPPSFRSSYTSDQN